jgi:succinate dehydrogenase / fumarate reductase iron-sulfur subunit
MLDVLNEGLIQRRFASIFDHDCREGICGSCSLYINGEASRSRQARTYLSIAHENVQGWRHHFYWTFRAKAFPVIKDLVVDRSAFDRIQQAGGFVWSIPQEILQMQMQFQL